jgi:hypothetical protein
MSDTAEGESTRDGAAAGPVAIEGASRGGPRLDPVARPNVPRVVR